MPEANGRSSAASLHSKQPTLNNTQRSSVGFKIAADKTGMTILDPLQIAEISPEQITRKYVDDCKNSMMVVGKIIKELIEAQNENAIQKFVKRVGKQYVAKEGMALAVMAYRTTADYGDKHREKDMYNYEDELIEPAPIRDSYMKINVLQKRALMEFDRLDTELDCSPKRASNLSFSKISRSSTRVFFDGDQNNNNISFQKSHGKTSRKGDLADISATLKKLEFNEVLSLGKISKKIKTSKGAGSITSSSIAELEFIPLAEPKPSASDIEYMIKSQELKDYLRKKTIHESIFKSTQFQLKQEASTHKVYSKEKNPLSNQNITCDFKGKPIKIIKVTNFQKKLASPEINIPSAPVSVIRDPEEIALKLGIPGDGFFDTASKLGKGEMGTGMVGTGLTSLGRTGERNLAITLGSN